MANYSSETIEYVNSIFGGYVTADEMYGGDDGFRWAMRYHHCAESCPGLEKCKVHGWYPRVHEEEHGGRRTFVVRATLCKHKYQAADRRQLNDLVKASRIPQELTACTFDTYKTVNESTANAKKFAIYCAESGSGLLLTGPPGVGKTHLAVAIVNHAISCGRTAIFIPVINLIDEIHEAIMNIKINSLMDALSAADCLALDDFGTQKNTDTRSERIFELINNRYNMKKQTVITTNARTKADVALLAGDNGERVASRLEEMTYKFEIEAPDYREQKKRARNGRKSTEGELALS
ncbi:MAG: ATP-binding protein [Synergistaceae bacterium]|jgi:DNA replication protein DnaC|nr:ATP-binding protein [Synergistaceae bacterium]